VGTITRLRALPARRLDSKMKTALRNLYRKAVFIDITSCVNFYGILYETNSIVLAKPSPVERKPWFGFVGTNSIWISLIRVFEAILNHEK
jgi:hypothetical protein